MNKGLDDFGPVFSGDSDYMNDAMIGFESSPEELYVLGYKKAADALVREMLSGSGPLDILIYPTVFLYRHYLELRVKNIVRLASKLHREPRKPWGHRLDGLWDEALELVRRLPEAESMVLDDLDFASYVISEYARLDPGSFTFRYADQLNGENPLDGLDRINVGRLEIMTDNAAQSLDGLSTWLGQLLDWEHEMTDWYAG